MASKPWLDPRRLVWLMKYRPVPGGPWVRVKLCKHEGSLPAPGSSRKPKPPVEAERRAREFEEIEFRAARGLGPAPVQARPLRDYLDEYAESRALSCAPGTIRLMKAGIDRFVEFASKSGVTTMQSVNRALCRSYLDSRAKSVAPNTLHAERGYLIGAWSRAVRDEVIPTNPWSGLKVPGKPKPTSITFWSDAEIAAIAASCAKPWQSDLVLFMANTGLRVSTALAARWSWIDASGRILKIGHGVNIKTSYSHVLSSTARLILERRKAATKGSPLVFAIEGRDKPPSYDMAAQAIGAAIVAAGARPGTAHDLRHSYGRKLGLSGVPITVVMKQLGHSSLQMTLKYVQVDEDQVGRFVEDIGVGPRPESG